VVVLIPLLYVGGGILILWVAAEALVRGASILGRAAGITPIVIGLTVVSIGTSAPELVVSLLAAVQGNPDLATGNIMGSNLANIGLVLALAAVIRPLRIAGQVVKREVPWMILVTLFVLPLMWDLHVSRLEGAVLVAALAVYLFFLIRMARREGPRMPRDDLDGPGPSTAPVTGVTGAPGVAAGARGWGRRPGARPMMLPVLLVIGGSAGLVAGGQGIVMGATELAGILGIPEVLVGLSVIAIGTSLPELATTIIAAVRREADLAVGNILGSNIFNLTFVLGGTALVMPVDIHPLIIRVEYPAVVALSLFLLPLAWTRRALDRKEGLLLLALFGGVWVWIIMARGF
jgi:cation:H+ antiporter